MINLGQKLKRNDLDIESIKHFWHFSFEHSNEHRETDKIEKDYPLCRSSRFAIITMYGRIQLFINRLYIATGHYFLPSLVTKENLSKKCQRRFQVGISN